MSWNPEKLKKYIQVAESVAQLSRDPSTKVGAVILGAGYEIRSTGYNGFPRGVSDVEPERYDRPLKYSLTAHAESNAVAQAAKAGTSIDGCALIVTALFPCTNCCKMIIQSGIKLILAPVPDYDIAVWGEEATISSLMLKEAGVLVLSY